MFFRASIVELASSLDLVGWVRNRYDGAVECVAEGDDDRLLALRRYCETGPSGACVERVDLIAEAETGEFSAFSVRPSG